MTAKAQKTPKSSTKNISAISLRSLIKKVDNIKVEAQSQGLTFEVHLLDMCVLSLNDQLDQRRKG